MTTLCHHDESPYLATSNLQWLLFFHHFLVVDLCICYIMYYWSFKYTSRFYFSVNIFFKIYIIKYLKVFSKHFNYYLVIILMDVSLTSPPLSPTQTSVYVVRKMRLSLSHEQTSHSVTQITSPTPVLPCVACNLRLYMICHDPIPQCVIYPHHQSPPPPQMCLFT